MALHPATNVVDFFSKTTGAAVEAAPKVRDVGLKDAPLKSLFPDEPRPRDVVSLSLPLFLCIAT